MTPLSGGLVCYAAYHWRAAFCDGECAVRQTSDIDVPLAPWAEGMPSIHINRSHNNSNALFTLFLTLSFDPLHSQMSVMHLLVRRHPSNTEPIKSKEELVFHCGFRRFRASPIFSQHTSGSSLMKSFKICSVHVKNYAILYFILGTCANHNS